MNLYALIIDAAILILAVLMTVSAYRKGFLSQVILLAGMIASVLVAVFLSRPGAEFVYNHFLDEPITHSIGQALEEGTDALHLEETIRSALDALPGFVANPIRAAYGGEEGLMEALWKDGPLPDSQQTGTLIAENFVSPIVISMLQALFFLLIFSICVIIVKATAGLFQGFDQVPLLGPLNSALGALVGAAQAAVVIFLLAMLMSVIISLTADGLSWMNSEIIRSTYLFKIFYEMAAG